MTSRSRFPSSGSQAAQAAGWLGPWLAVVALGLWAATPDGTFLVLAAGGVVAAVVWTRPRRIGAVGVTVLLAGILAGFAAHRQVSEIELDWDGYWRERVAWVGEHLDQALDERLRAGESAADALAALAADPVARTEPAHVEVLRRRAGLNALALYDYRGDLMVWAGEHRGKVPEMVQRGLRRYSYGELPLFGYLYVTAPAANGGVAVAVTLLKTELPPGLGADMADFSSEFRRRIGEEVAVVPDAPPGSEGVWDLELPDRNLLSVVLREPAPEERAAEILARWRGLVALLALLAWGLLAAGGPPRLAAGLMAAGGLMVLAGSLPLQLVGGLEPLFTMAAFQPRGLPELSLGRFALLVLAAVTAVAILPRPRLRIPYWLAAVLAAAAGPALLTWMGEGVAPTLLAQGELPWIVYQGAAATLLTVVVGSLLVFTSSQSSKRWLGLVAFAVAVGMGGWGASYLWSAAAVPVWWPALLGVPVAVAARSLGAWGGWQRPVARWVLAAAIAGAATVPTTWAHRIEARMAMGEERLHALAAEVDPEVEQALMALAGHARVLDHEAVNQADLLYASWRRSGIAELGQPVWLTLWSASGIPSEELGVGVTARPIPAEDHLSEGGMGDDVRLLLYDRDDARYVLRVPLSDRRLLTVVAPPFVDPSYTSPLSPLLSSGLTTAGEPLTLIPLQPGDAREDVPLQWVRTDSGWQGELPLVYPRDLYHAHYAVDLPGALLATARGTLLLLLNLVVFFSFWGMGRGLLRDALPPEARWSGLVVSFRARVTLALFGFFLLANLVFGTLASRTLEGASRRAARVLAQRVVEDAAASYLEVQGSMSLLAGRVGAELLEYREGELREGSMEELVELGLYDGWMPFEIRRRLDGREGVREFTEGRFGEWAYVTAYRRLPDGDLLAAQIPLQAGATAIRTEDLVELLGFAVVMGGLLSLGLAFLVGRALTRPIQELRVASERVGAGNLSLRLTDRRQDEFGAVFKAFNRMVRRIRKARRQQVRTTRRTQAIMEEAAVGMVALDADARVTLVNPRAEAVLEQPVTVGEGLPTDGVLAASLSAWLRAYLDGDSDESGVDLHAGERRVRVRARRLERRPARGGVVVALEDVTDELRTERVLAWGEMARQVAHEVKNPLTPIKLSVQHLRRAWDDRPSDFDSILKRNADAILREIDRLAAIAQSFSRFGAPSDADAGPLMPVDVSVVVREVLALYGASEGPVEFRGVIPEGLPPVTARHDELKEVLVNLLENARAGVGEAGLVRIEASERAGGEVEVAVVDDGAGIAQELIPKVLEPHFSTRSTGTGLGLAIVGRLVESWGGDVSLTSREGEGTRVRLLLRAWSLSDDVKGGPATPQDPS